MTSDAAPADRCRASIRRPVCRLHGGKEGGPKGECNGAYRTGHYAAEAKAERRELRALVRELWQAQLSWRVVRELTRFCLGNNQPRCRAQMSRKSAAWS